MDAEWEKTNPDKEKRKEQQATPRTKHQRLEDEVDKLTRDIDKTLKVSDDHAKALKDHLSGELTQDEIESRDPSTEPDLDRYLSSTAGRSGHKVVERNGDGLGHIYPHIKDSKSEEKSEKPSL